MSLESSPGRRAAADGSSRADETATAEPASGAPTTHSQLMSAEFGRSDAPGHDSASESAASSARRPPVVKSCWQSFRLLFIISIVLALAFIFGVIAAKLVREAHNTSRGSSLASTHELIPPPPHRVESQQTPHREAAPIEAKPYGDKEQIVTQQHKGVTPSLDPHSDVHLHRAQQFVQSEQRRLFARSESLGGGADQRDEAKGDSIMDVPDYLFLRSASRPRVTYSGSVHPSEADENQRATIAIIAPAVVVGDPAAFTSTSFAVVNDDAAFGADTGHDSSASPPLAVPFLVHCKTPLTSGWRRQLESALSQDEAGGYHVDRYVQVGNFLVVPNDAQSNQTQMQRVLESLRPKVVAWHQYEPQDKIDPWLFSNCRSTHSLIHDEIRDSDVPTFDLSVSLFHDAVTGDHFHTRAAGEKNQTRRRRRSHHGIPRPTKRIVARWQHELVARGPLWEDIRVHAEAAHIVAVSIPIAFFQQHPESASHVTVAAPSFCDLLNLFASEPHTEFIEQSAAFETHNKYASPLVQDGTYTRPGVVHQHGLTGRGQVVTVADTGVAHGSCFFKDPAVPTPIDTVNFAHRKIVSYVSTRGKTYDMPSGHGTHTAASIAGQVLPSSIEYASAAESDTLRHLSEFNGVAYEAKLAVFDVNDGLSAGKIKPPKDIYGQYFQLAYETMNARISSNSWGSKNGTYIVECRETDRFVLDHPDFLPIFSSGNYGERGYQSVVAPGTAKNCLTVGATGNVKVRTGVTGPFYCAMRRVEPKSSPGYSLAQSHLEDDDEQFVDESIYMRRLYSFISGAGPTYDARFKPEVLAPGHYVVSARSEGAPELDHCRDCERSLMSLFGTSMSAAIAAGSASLVRQYFVDGFYPTGVASPPNAFTPSAALLKAVLIASAVSDTVESGIGEGHFDELNPTIGLIPDQTGPTPKSGFGRLQLDRVLRLTGRTVDLWVLDQKQIETGDFHAYCFRIKRPVVASPNDTTTADANSSPSDAASPRDFRATLVWSDPPAALSSSWLLINNLDLSVSSVATGSVSVGNQHWTDTAPLFDTTNNVEQVHLPSHALQTGGLMSVHVRGTSVPQGPQSYALVVSGSFEAVPVQTCAGGVVCPRSCTGRGTCTDAGVCQCQAGFTGVSCEQSSTLIDSCTRVSSTVPFGKWTFYHLDIAAPLGPGTPPQSLRVLMRSLAGEPDLYISHGRLPSLQDHDFAHLLAGVNSDASDSSESQVDIPIALPGRYFIGVYGYCCAAESQFQIEARRCQESTTTPPPAPTEPYSQVAQVKPVNVAARPCTCAAATTAVAPMTSAA